MKRDTIVLRATIDSMVHSIEAVLVDHGEMVRGEVARAFAAYAEDGLARDVAEAVRRHCRTAIEDRVRWAISHAVQESKEIDALIASAVAKALERT